MLEVEERLYRRAEIVNFLAVSDATFDRLVARGEIEVLRLGPRTVRVTQSSLTAFLARAKGREG